MTANLAIRASGLRLRLEALEKAASNVAEVSALEGLRGDLASRTQKLAVEQGKQLVLTASKITVPDPKSIIAARKRAAGLLEKFLVERKASTLKRGQGWRLLLEETDAATGELASVLMSAWRAYRQAVFAGETPAQIRGKLAHTKENDAVFDEYQRLFTELRAKFDTLPNDQAAVKHVESLAERLVKVGKSFNFNVPADVKRFLEAVLSVNGAPLSLLTPAVQEWLTANGSLDSYSIRAAA